MIKATTSAKRVRFKGNPRKELFIQDLRKRVANYFDENGISPYANTEMYLKTAFAMVSWIATYAWIMSDTLSEHPIALYLVYLLLGYIHIFIAFNIMHDATHNAYSSNNQRDNRIREMIVKIFNVDYTKSI